MTLSRILDTKGTVVTTAAPHRTLAEIVSVLADKNIGAVVVTSADGDVLGIVSERDIIRALAQDGATALSAAVSRYMTRTVETATRDTPIETAMEVMTDGRFRHLPVVEQGRLAGLISIGDVVKHRLERIEQEKRSMLDYIGTA